MKIKSMIVSLLMLCCSLEAEVKYEILDVGTLQTQASEAIALNLHGEILGWYNVDGKAENKFFFFRDKYASFHEIPKKDNNGPAIIWKYLKDDGKVYGTNDDNANYSVLYVWDQKNGIVKLGNLPAKNIAAINNAGQVLISSISETENGKVMQRPVIWHHGVVTKLRGLEGNVGIESDNSCGLDMNNNGDVVGNCVVSINYKDKLYTQTHAVKWTNGKIIDMHNKVPKTASTSARAINDLGEVLIGSYLVKTDGTVLEHPIFASAKTTQNKYFYTEGSGQLINRSGNVIMLKDQITLNLSNDYDSIWLNFNRIVSVNNKGEAIAVGTTIYGENHIMFLIPVSQE